jgi:MFS family permease
MSSLGFLRSPIFPLLLVNFIGALGYGIILPFLAFLVIDFGGNEVIYGLIASSYPLFQMFGAPLLGSWSDRVGRKRVLLVSQAGTLLSWIIFLLAFIPKANPLLHIQSSTFGEFNLTWPLIIVLLARAMDGLTGGNISVANAYLSDISTEAERKKRFGQMSSSMSLGFILGPAIAGLLASISNGNLLTIIVTAFISLLGLIAIQFLLPEVKPKTEVYKPDQSKIKKTLGVECKECVKTQEEKSAWMQVVLQPKAPFMIALFFLIFLAFNLFYSTFSVHTVSNLNWTPRRLGFFFTVLSGVMIIGQGPMLSYLSKKYSDLLLFCVGSVAMAATFVCMTSNRIEVLYFAAVLFGLGNGIMWPSYLAMLSKVGSPQKQGSLQGLANSSGSLASIIGLSVGGVLLSLIQADIYLISALLLIGIAMTTPFFVRGSKLAS